MKTKLLLASTFATAAAITLTAIPSDDAHAKKAKEKCYGIVKAGANDCGTSAHSCAGQAPRDNHPEEWVYMPKGLCERLAGASLEPKTDG